MFRDSLVGVLLLLPGSSAYAAVEFYVSPSGNDANLGTRGLPFATLDRARQAVAQRADRSGSVTVFLAGGTYYLPDTLVFQISDRNTRQRCERDHGPAGCLATAAARIRRGTCRMKTLSCSRSSIRCGRYAQETCE